MKFKFDKSVKFRNWMYRDIRRKKFRIDFFINDAWPWKRYEFQVGLVNGVDEKHVFKFTFYGSALRKLLKVLLEIRKREHNLKRSYKTHFGTSKKILNKEEKELLI